MTGNARFFKDRGGILLRRRIWFTATGAPPIRLDSTTYQRMDGQRLDTPQRVGGYRDRVYWWFGDAIYWTNREELAT